MTTELEHSVSAVPNASYDSAIDSLDEYYCDLTLPSSLSLGHSPLVSGKTDNHMTRSATTASLMPYQSKFSKKISLSPSLNNPISSNSNSNSTQSHHSTSNTVTNATSDYRSLADYHRVYLPLDNEQTLPKQQQHPLPSPNQYSIVGEPRSRPKSGISRIVMFLEQIGTSTSPSTFIGGGQTRQPGSSSSGLTGPHSMRRGTTSFLSQSELNLTAADKGQHGAPEQVRHPNHSGQSQQQVRRTSDTPTLDSSSASTPLRSSRSFTTSYRQRPNVTLTRRKSASERLAETRSKYIRSDLDASDTLTEDVVACDMNGTKREEDVSQYSRRCLRTTSTSSRSAQTASSRVSPSSDHFPTVSCEEKGINSSCECSKPGRIQSSIPCGSVAECRNYSRHYPDSDTHSHSKLTAKIHSQLNRSRHMNSMPQEFCPKKRVSPKNSDGTSNLEIQLRELISLDPQNEIPTGKESTSNEELRQSCRPLSNSTSELQKQREAANIYRAELKFIGSSCSSSLSSMYSEPNLSPTENHLSSSDKFPVALSAEPQAKQLLSNVVRSKSDVSPNKIESDKYRNRYKSHIERLFGSLGLDSQLYPGKDGQSKLVNGKSSQSSNLQNYTASSVSNESLRKLIDSFDSPCERLARHKTILSAPKSSSTNELSSLNSSQLSVADHIYSSDLSHSKSTSKLTIENLMLHQQNLASSRSCHNLMVNLHNGPSVVERNARIIKWLFNCRKAMTQSPKVDTCR